jgi:FAD dependent oxidoreductase TIGR03364
VTRVVVVGGGILGSMHAWMARRRGHAVVHLEREAEARGASVRNFGLVWVSGRAGGAELELALRSRELWDQVAASAPGVGLRPQGSVTVAASPGELDVLEAAMTRPDAPDRQWRLLGPDEARRLNPTLAGKILGALHCALDATVEPRRAARAIRESLTGSDYTWLPGRTVMESREGAVRDHLGSWHEADRVVLCCGADHQGVMAPALTGAPLRRVRLQMLETAPDAQWLTTAVADGDSLRYYPAYDLPALSRLPPQDPLSAHHRIQLLMVQRDHGGLTIGDTHEYDEPFDFAVQDEVYANLVARAEAVLGRQVGPVARRWAGVYSQTTDASLYLRRPLVPGVEVVTGPGGRGMTLSAAIAEETFP